MSLTSCKLRNIIDQPVLRKDLTGFLADISGVTSFSDGTIIGKVKDPVTLSRKDVIRDPSTFAWLMTG